MAAKRVINVLVVGETGDGKSTLINELRDKARSEEPLVGDSPEGITKELCIYPGPDINGCSFNLVDTPGVGDVDPMTLVHLIETFLTKLPGGVSGVIVTMKVWAARVTLGAQIMKAIVDKGFAGTGIDGDKYGNIILCGTQTDKATQPQINQFYFGKDGRKSVKEMFFSWREEWGPQTSFRSCCVMVGQSKEALSNLLQAIAQLPPRVIEYKKIYAGELGYAMSQIVGGDARKMEKEIEQSRQAYARLGEQMEAEKKEQEEKLRKQREQQAELLQEHENERRKQEEEKRRLQQEEEEREARHREALRREEEQLRREEERRMQLRREEERRMQLRWEEERRQEALRRQEEARRMREEQQEREEAQRLWEVAECLRMKRQEEERYWRQANHVTKVEVFGGAYVDHVVFWYGNRSKQFGTRGGGLKSSISLADDEYITEVHGSKYYYESYGHHQASIVIKTNRGQTANYDGGKAKQGMRSWRAPRGQFISEIHRGNPGQAADVVDVSCKPLRTF